MTQITLSNAVATQLHGLTAPVALCDTSGKVLGRFIPAIDASEWEPVSPEVSEDELDRRQQGTEWYSTQEVLSHLKSLEQK